VIIVTYNSERYVGGLLESLAEAGRALELEIIVVDNGSTDASVCLARRAPGVTLIEAGRNVGYAGGINLGLRHAGPSKAVAILNPDLTLRPRALEQLCAALDEPSVGIAVPCLIEGCSTYPSLRREPSIGRALGDAVCGGRLRRRFSLPSETVPIGPWYTQGHDLDWATGAALVVSASCLRAVGEWDESFFLYSEETDFFRRARDRGWRVRFVPEAGVCHDQGGSGRSDALVALMAVNRIRYYEKWHGRLASRAFRGVVVLHEFLRAKDAGHRAALRAVARRSSWSRLPGPSRQVSSLVAPRRPDVQTVSGLGR
jgi:GT2 family glycosyltransferase